MSGLTVFPNLAQSDLQRQQLAEQKAQTALLQKIVTNQSIQNAMMNAQGVTLMEIAKLDAAVLEELKAVNKFISDFLHPHLVSIGIVPGKPTTHD